LGPVPPGVVVPGVPWAHVVGEVKAQKQKRLAKTFTLQGKPENPADNMGCSPQASFRTRTDQLKNPTGG
jgi:hypothetical protein